jgi:seryl-tRNA synthetase
LLNILTWSYFFKNVFLLNSREKEDLLQQSSEIRQKLQGKVNECLSLEKSRDEAAKKLNETQLLIQQVSKNIFHAVQTRL